MRAVRSSATRSRSRRSTRRSGLPSASSTCPQKSSRSTRTWPSRSLQRFESKVNRSTRSWSPRNQGYESNQQIRPSTGYPDPKESYQVGFQRTEEQEALWPTEEDCPGFRRETEEFMRKVQGLSVKVMELFAEGLGLVGLARPPS